MNIDSIGFANFAFGEYLIHENHVCKMLRLNLSKNSQVYTYNYIEDFFWFRVQQRQMLSYSSKQCIYDSSVQITILLY